jgi:DNA polymerase lambda
MTGPGGGGRASARLTITCSSSQSPSTTSPPLNISPSTLMVGTDMFARPAWHDDVFAHLDRIDTDPAFDDDPEDVKEYEDWVRAEVERKLGLRQPSSSTNFPVDAPQLVSATSRSSPPPPRLSSPITSRITRSTGVGTTQLSTRHTIATPARISTAPTVETPTLTAPLPAPPTARPRLLDTPVSIATPQTPDATHPSAIARGRRDDPATPVPLGTAELAKLKKREGFQKLTKHIASIVPPPADPQPAPGARGRTRGRSRGRGRGRLGMTGRVNIGGNALAGTRICLAPSGPCKPRAEIVSCVLWVQLTTRSLTWAGKS